ncbi:MAG: hypothetical protein A3H31_09810 [Gallionellales bacterium RIFCSPLOWO2_02_FULL_57_47]|nr:MAG: hypothetical protein A3H31_09810 [Gallionellales bacterium RIFCSPLOWO2_02_FULL_57_47]
MCQRTEGRNQESGIRDQGSGIRCQISDIRYQMADMTELFHILQSSPLIFTGMCAVLGLMVGSFSSDITRKQISLH